MRTSRQNTVLFHSIIQRLISNNNQLFNIRQQEYYVVTDKLKCHKLCSKFPLFSLTQLCIRTSHPQHSVAVTLSRISGDRQTECGLWIKSCLMLNCLKFHQIIHSMTRLHTSKYPVLAKKWYPELIWLIACCKHAPTLARQKWRHNYIIGPNKYLISTLSESTAPWVYSLQFLFKSTHQWRRYERKREWVFLFWTQCIISVYFISIDSAILQLIISFVGV